MIIAGTVLAIGLTLAFTVVFGPYGALLSFAILFGLVFSTHQRNKRIYEDLQIIKQKLGIDDKDEFHLKNKEEEKDELVDDLEKTEKRELSDLDKQIEQELEEIYQKGQENERKGKK